jgi:hypothetical protein
MLGIFEKKKHERHASKKVTHVFNLFIISFSRALTGPVYALPKTPAPSICLLPDCLLHALLPCKKIVHKNLSFMEKKIFHPVRVGSRILLAAILLLAGKTTQAQPGVQKQEFKKATVIYNGIQNNLVSFTVKYENPEGDLFSIQLTDHAGLVLFEGSFTDRKFQNVFQVAKPEETEFSFLIKNLKTNECRTFPVNTKLLEE